MDLRLIRFFLQVASSGSFSKAAMQLGVPQPSLSRNIRKLEHTLGGDLFHRDGRGAHVTPLGRSFMVHAQTIVDAWQDATREAHRQTRSIRGSVSFGLPSSVGRVLSVPLAQRLGELYPDLSIRILEGFSGHVAEWLQNGQIDIAVLYRESLSPGLISEALAAEELYCFATPDAFRAFDGCDAADTPVAFGALEGTPLVLPGRSHGLRRHLERAARENNLDLHVALEVDALYTTFEAARARIGMAIMPRAALARDLLSNALVARRIEAPVLQQNLYLATGARRPGFSAGPEIISLIKAISAELVDQELWVLARPD